MKDLISITLLIIICHTSATAQTPPKFIDGTDGMNAVQLIAFNNKLAFLDSSGLYTYAEGDTPKQLTAIDSNVFTKGVFYAGEQMAVVNNMLYFMAFDTSGLRVYHWNGTDSALRVNAIPSGNHNNLYSAYGKLYLAEYAKPNNMHVYVYDPVADTCIPIFKHNSNSFDIIAFNNKMYFNTRAAIHEHDPVTNITQVLPSVTTMHNCSDMQVIENKLYFIGTNGGNTIDYQLNVYDGINPALALTTGTNTIKPGKKFVHLKGSIYFLKSLNSLWVYNMSTQAITEVPNAVQAMNQPTSAFLHLEHDDKIYLSAGSQGLSIYTFDGTSISLLDANILMNYVSRIVMIGDIGYFAGFRTSLPKTGVYHFADWLTSVKQLPTATAAKLYPNPAAQTATLEFSIEKQDHLSFNITDAMGRIVYTHPTSAYKAGDNKIEFDVQGFATGIYHCRLATENNTLVWSGKLVKE